MPSTNTEAILGQQVRIGTLTSVAQEIVADAEGGTPGYICFTTAYMLVEARRDSSISSAYAAAAMILPDGVPVAWCLHALGHPQAECISGPRLTPLLLQEAARRDVSVGFYGGRPETLSQMIENLRRDLPTLKIDYVYSPPFRALSPTERQTDRDEIMARGVQLLFVGLGSPKQDLWMQENTSDLPLVSLGVGAAFEFLSGEKYLPPLWIQRLGLTWLIRLCQEPRRLLRRNLYSPIFVLLFLKQCLWQHRSFARAIWKWLLYSPESVTAQPEHDTPISLSSDPHRDARSGSVLVVGPGVRGRGGIATVIQRHAETETWSRRRLRWLSTFDDRSTLHKLGAALAAYLAAPVLLVRAEMVHVHLAAQTSVLRKLPIVAMARLLARPVIVHIHAPSEESFFSSTPRWARRFLFKSAARVVVLSQSWASIVHAHEPSSHIVVMANPVRDFDAAPRHSGAPQVVFFAGKLDARKGYADLLTAAAEVLRQSPEVTFRFAGHGEVPQARAIAAELGIAAHVEFLGWLDTPALDQAYAEAIVFALPSYAEGVPMSVLEAMSHGVPVICTPVGGLPELIDDGINGLFVNPGDTKSLAQRLVQLLHDPAQAAAIGAAGRVTVRQTCSLAQPLRRTRVPVRRCSVRVRLLPRRPSACRNFPHPLSDRNWRNQVTAQLRLAAHAVLVWSTLSLGIAARGQTTPPKPHRQDRGDFRLTGLHSPAVVSGSIFVEAPDLPPGSAVRYLLDDQACSAATDPPYAIAPFGGLSLNSLPPGIHHLRAEATLSNGTTLRSDDLILDVVPSINHRFSSALTPYANQPSAQSRDLRSILRDTSTPGVTLPAAEARVRRKVLAMYLNWGIDPSLDGGNDQSDVLRALHPTAWAASAGGLGREPLSLQFSVDAPFYQAIPKRWPRVLLPAGYLHNVQLNTTEEGDGIGFGESVADARDAEREVQSQWYDNTATRRVFSYRLSPDWPRRLPWQPAGDRHMIFVDPVEKTFVSGYKTSPNANTGGAQALYASSPVKLETLGDQGGSIAAGFAELPAMLQPGEATDRARPIRHALGGSVSRAWAARVYPASAWDTNVKTSGDSCTGKGYTNTGLVPYGGVIQLDPDLDLTALGLTLPRPPHPAGHPNLRLLRRGLRLLRLRHLHRRLRSRTEPLRRAVGLQPPRNRRPERNPQCPRNQQALRGRTVDEEAIEPCTCNNAVRSTSLGPLYWKTLSEPLYRHSDDPSRRSAGPGCGRSRGRAPRTGGPGGRPEYGHPPDPLSP